MVPFESTVQVRVIAVLRLLWKLITAFEEIDSGPVTLTGTLGNTRLFLLSQLWTHFRFQSSQKGARIQDQLFQAWHSM